MVPAGGRGARPHALLHDHPRAVGRRDEAVQVEIETVLHGGGIDLGDEAARARERVAVETRPLAERDQLQGSLARLRAAPAADDETQLLFAAGKSPPQSAEDARGDSARVPVHSHHAAAALAPERTR